MKIESRIARLLGLAALALALVALGCSADVGASCDTPGSLDECVDGAVCTNESGGANTCRLLCADDADCPVGHNCNGLTGTQIKSCQP